MYTAQRVIKAVAIVLAFGLICGIFSTIISGGMLLTRIFDERGEVTVNDAMEVAEVGDLIRGEIEHLSVDIATAQLEIERGDELAVMTNDDSIEVRRDGDTLYIRENGVGFFNTWTVDRQVRIVVPRDWDDLDSVKLITGVGSVKVSDLTARVMEIELGAGRAELVNLVATERAKIDSGAGYLSVRESEFRNLDLDMGAGKVELGAQLKGSNDIDAGVGKLELNLRGGEESYRFKIDKGIGAITLNGDGIDGGETRGSGEVLVDIDGGVGAIEIRV